MLAEADWVVASVHYGQNQSREQITNRVIDALENPHVSAIAHPTGRLINRRKPYEVDLDAVFKAAREHGKMMELNANPHRLDLDDVACATAKRFEVPIVISSDAHSTADSDVLRYGVLAGTPQASLRTTSPTLARSTSSEDRSPEVAEGQIADRPRGDAAILGQIPRTVAGFVGLA